MKTLGELDAPGDGAWEQLRAELASSHVSIRIIEAEVSEGGECLRRLQVSTQSRLGSVARYSAGIVVESGWLKVLGAGSSVSGLPGIIEMNGLGIAGAPPVPALLVGFDVLGGRFELNGPDSMSIGRPGRIGDVCYFAPDTLEWESLDFGYGAWLSWIAAGRTPDFYQDFRWSGWREEIESLGADLCLSFYPYLFSAEAQSNIAATSRKPAPAREIFALHESFARQFGTLA
ncbi:DUF2625 family protein [Longispora sp. K20-0274]|uniref:DUF2625 family protein n=1 Tax=Longispora sp. K20-0274 TaxID=3088255 RepID=UPI00399C3FDF